MKKFITIILILMLCVFVCGAYYYIQTRGGAGSSNEVVIPGGLCINGGIVYLGPTTTPSLGVHDEHGTFYSKGDTRLYYQYDQIGQTEKIVRIDAGTGVTTIQRVLIRIEPSGEDILIYYIDLIYVDGIVTAISAEGSYAINTQG